VAGVSNNNNMRLAIYAPVFTRPTETFIYDATAELAACGMALRIFAADCPLPDEKRVAPVTVIPKPGRLDLQRLWRRVLRPLKGRPEGGEAAQLQRETIGRHLQQFRPDVILANYGQSGVLLAPLAASLGIPLMVSFHGVDASRLGRDPDWQRRYRRMFGTVAVATGPSEYVRQKLISLGCPPERAHVLHYGIRTDLIRFIGERRRADDDEVRFLFVGRLAEKKDPLTLLKSFRKTLDLLAPRSAVLTIVGDGPLRQATEAAIGELGLGDSVRLTGRQTHDEVIAHFENAHIYVQHSVTAPNGDEEGLPVSITEALAAGLPVVSTRHSGIPEAVRENECGLLVDEKDVDGMAAAMAQLAGDRSACDQFGSTGRTLLEAEFSTPVVQRRLRELLRLAAASREEHDQSLPLGATQSA
jgi:glycosyltransferase involved in cell wall biosynthesis